MNITALDLSLTSTGVADEDGVRTIVPKHKGIERVEEIRAKVVDEANGPDLFVIENYAFHGHDAYAHALGELGGVVRHCIWTTGIPYCDLNLTSIKMYATGKGNAKKEQMLAEAIRRLGYEGHSNDEADALWMREMALDHYGLLDKPRAPESHRKALASVAWPEVPA